MKTKRCFLVMAMALFAGFALCACDSDDDNNGGGGSGSKGGTLELTLSSTDEISYVGGNIDVTVKSDGYWSVKADQNWISFDPLRGNKDGSFKVKVANNPTEQSRSAKVTVSLEDTDVTKEFTVIQEPLSVNFEITKTGNLMADYIGIKQFSFLGPQVGLLFKYEIMAPGTLTISMPNSHIHTMLATKEPAQYAPTGNGQVDETIPTVQGGDVWENLAIDSKTGEQADFKSLYPRSKPKVCKIHLDTPGTYWACHTPEINVKSAKPTDEWGNTLEDAEEVETPGATDEMFPLTENYEIKVTFVAD